MEKGYDIARLRSYDRNILRTGYAALRVLEQTPHCWMCPDTDVPRTKEHIFARSLQKHLPDHVTFAEPVRYAHGGTVLASKRGRTSGEKLVAGGVCARCNNGWMSALELAVTPFLLGQKNLVASKDAEMLTRWFVKTAVVINAVMPYRLLWTAERRHQVQYTVPNRIQVWIYQVPELDMNWKQGAEVYSVTLPPDKVERWSPKLDLLVQCQIQFRNLVGVVLARPSEFTNADASMESASLLWSDGQGYEVDLTSLPLHGKPFMQFPHLDVRQSVFYK